MMKKGCIRYLKSFFVLMAFPAAAGASRCASYGCHGGGGDHYHLVGISMLIVQEGHV